MKEYARIIFPGGETYISAMSSNDIEAVAAMYRDIQITTANLCEKLTAGNEYSFENTGGMFVVLDAEGLSKIINSRLYTATVVKDSRNRIIAFMWTGITPDGGNIPKKILYYDNCRHFADDIRKAIDSSELSWEGEIVVGRKDNEAYPRITFPLFYTHFTLLQKMGIRFNLGEVYRVTGYMCDGKYTKIDMLNERSKKVLERTGAIIIGETPEKIISQEGFEVTVKPLVVCFDILKSLDLMSQKIKTENLTYICVDI